MSTKEPTYDDAQIAEKLAALPGWYYDDGWIRRYYKTDGWPTTSRRSPSWTSTR